MNIKVNDKVVVKSLTRKEDSVYTDFSSKYVGKIGTVEHIDKYDDTIKVSFVIYGRMKYHWFEMCDIELYEKYKTRGFEVVADEHRKHEGEIKIPVRGDSRSAGYDFFSNEDVTLNPGESHLFWTDIKSYMFSDEVLSIHVRSSIGVKKGLMLKNTTGIIDSSYYENVSNDGNIGICLVNMSNEVQTISKHERIAQGVFSKYLMVDEDNCLKAEREGGFGSSGK